MRPSTILALALLLPLLAAPALGAPADDPRPIVQASEILAKIERGEPVRYDGVIVVGDLDLSEVDLPTKHVERTDEEIEYWDLTENVKVVESSISVKDSEIRGGVNLGNTIFQEPINFWRTNFSGDADFIGAQFRGDNTDFSNAKFCGRDTYFYRSEFSGGNSHFNGTEFIRGNASFGWAVFSGGFADFEGAKFRGGDADFRWATFSGGVANFRWAKFSGGDADFKKATFSGGNASDFDANFDWAEFSGGDANFKWAEFSGDNTNFWGSKFSGGGADFGEAEFSGGNTNFGKAKFSGGNANFGEAMFSGGDVNFKWAEFSSVSANFEGAVFSGGNVDFEAAKFSGGDINFNGAEFSENVYFEDSSFNQENLTLEDAKNIHILRMSDTTFENGSTICLNGTNYERLYVPWNQIKDGFVYNGEAYLNLVKNFKTIEYFEDADDCYYQYRRERQSMRSGLEVAKYTDILGWVTCGYGVRPGYTLLLGLFVVLVSAVYYWRRDAIRRLKGDEDESAKFSDAFYFSMMTFTTVGYGDWYPLDRHRKVVMIEGIIGWLTLSLFLVTLANVIIR